VYKHIYDDPTSERVLEYFQEEGFVTVHDWRPKVNKRTKQATNQATSKHQTNKQTNKQTNAERLKN
jgi:hypothetical protein